jgi:hypothetical protein
MVFVTQVERSGRVCCARAAGGEFRVILALSAFASAAAFPATSRAAPPTVVSLDYEVNGDSSGCPDVEEFRASVGRQLGYDPFRPAADRHVAVQISRTDQGFKGHITWNDAEGHSVGDRRFSSQRSKCNEIAANMAFTTAVQIQLLASLASAPTTPGATQTDNSPSPPDTRASDASGTTTSQSKSGAAGAPDSARESTESKLASTFRLSAGLGVSLGFGVAPHLTGLGRIFVSGRLDWVSLELAADGALLTTRKEDDGSGFSLNRFAAGAAACGHIRGFAACLTGTLGRIEARGLGVDKPASPAGLFSELGARIAVRYEFSDRFFAGARVDGLVMLSPWKVTLNDTVLWTLPRAGGLIGVDLGIDFF